MSSKRVRALVVVCAAVPIAGSIGAVQPAKADGHAKAKHVLLISVDGMHQGDLAWYVANHPTSTLAGLVKHGVEFTNAQTPVPSDSFPGMIAQVTGGNPSSTGIYYDDSWNAALLPAGTTNCTGVTPGVEVTYFEALDKNPHSLDAGQGLTGLPGSVLKMTGNPTTLIDPTLLPVDPATCKPVYPHSYLKVNTIFEVARAAGLRTAWSDKHAAYEILNGPSDTGVQDLFTPEINSDAPNLGDPIDWTKVNSLTQQYDSYKVQAVINEVKGFDHSGAKRVGTPALFGLNFQTVSTAEKLPTSDGKTGGYLAGGVTPGPLLSGALDYINTQLGLITDALDKRDLTDSTVIVLSAKHGQSPQDPAKLTRIKDSVVLGDLDAAWKAKYPTAVQPLVAMSVNDDGMLVWLNDRSDKATGFAKDFLLGYSKPTGDPKAGNDINGNSKGFTQAGLTKVLAGEDAADYFKVKTGDSRVPDIFGISQVGTVFTGGKGKIAEHGGANPQDRDVPLLVSGGPIGDHSVKDSSVETTQIAPTILQLLGLDSDALKAVQIEGTEALPISTGG